MPIELIDIIKQANRAANISGADFFYLLDSVDIDFKILSATSFTVIFIKTLFRASADMSIKRPRMFWDFENSIILAKLLVLNITFIVL